MSKDSIYSGSAALLERKSDKQKVDFFSVLRPCKHSNAFTYSNVRKCEICFFFAIIEVIRDIENFGLKFDCISIEIATNLLMYEESTGPGVKLPAIYIGRCLNQTEVFKKKLFVSLTFKYFYAQTCRKSWSFEKEIFDF